MQQNPQPVEILRHAEFSGRTCGALLSHVFLRKSWLNNFMPFGGWSMTTSSLLLGSNFVATDYPLSYAVHGRMGI